MNEDTPKIYEQAMKQVKEDYDSYNGEPIDSIAIGIGYDDHNGYCIYDLTTKKILHKYITKEQTHILVEELRKKIK